MKFIFGMQRNIENFYKLILSFQICVARHAQSTQSKKFAYLCNTSRKTLGMKVIFILQITIKAYFKLILSFYVCVARHAQITQNNNYGISFQCLQKEVNSQVNFLHGDKHESFLHIYPMIFDGDGYELPKFPKQQVCYTIFLQCLYNV